EPLEPCAPANPANRASPSMLASFPANMVNHDSPPLENPSNRFCLFGTRSSVPALGIPVVAMATPVDPIFTRSHRICRLRRIAQKDRRTEAAQEKDREVTQSDED